MIVDNKKPAMWFCFSISPNDDEMYVKLICILTMSISSILLGQPTISRKLTFCIFY